MGGDVCQPFKVVFFTLKKIFKNQFKNQIFFILKFWIWNFDTFFKKSYLSLSTDNTINFLVNDIRTPVFHLDTLN
jgi:hypothetical protein